MLSVMESLLPETAEGGDARAGSNKDARMGGVLRELEAAGTDGDRKREALILRHHGRDAHAAQRLSSGGVCFGW